MGCEKKWIPRSGKMDESGACSGGSCVEAGGGRRTAAGRRPQRKRMKTWIVMTVLGLLLCACGRRVKDASADDMQTVAQEEGAVSNTATPDASDGDATAKNEATLSFSKLSEIPDGRYWISVTLTGGSGRASIASPTGFYVQDGQATADIHWSSAHYDYMLVDGVRYDASVDEETGNARMTIPVSALNTPISVIADTTAMSKPYEIEYTLSFDGSALLPMEDLRETHSLATTTVEEAMQKVKGASADSADASGKTGSVTESQGVSSGKAGESAREEDSAEKVHWSAVPEIEGLRFLSSEKNETATYFRLSQYEDEAGARYQLLETAGGLYRYLLVPENAKGAGETTAKKQQNSASALATHFTARAVEDNAANKEKKGDVLPLTVVQQPLTTSYVAASATMAPLCDIGASTQIRFSGLRAEGWYVDAARTAMQEGRMLFAGKYSEPDYETLLREGCDLALESTMILRKPEVKEKLESLGIPVYIDYSSYEPHVLGRMEWIRVYGALFGREKEATAFYQKERARLQELEKEAVQETSASGAAAAKEKPGTAAGVDAGDAAMKAKTGMDTRPTVVYFYVNAAGQIQVRQQNDYIPELLEMAGARYLAPTQSGLGAHSRKTNVTVSVEDFYRTCKDADVLIYSATLDEPLSSIDALLEKNTLFADFKAVQEGHVYTTDKDFYQLSDRMADFAEDVRKLLTGGGEMHFLKPVRG